jgi:leucyl aminopeptidase
MTTLRFDTTSPADVKVDALVLPVFEGPEAGPGVKEVGDALETDLLEVYRWNKLRGRLGETLTIPTLGRIPAATVFLVGIEWRDKFSVDKLRRGIGGVASRLARYGSVATTFPQAARSTEEAVQATVEGLLLGSYRFDRYKVHPTERDEVKPSLRSVVILGSGRSNGAQMKGVLERTRIVADSVAWARDLVNTPALVATPEYLASEARRMAKQAGLQVKIWTERELERGGFGGILGVGQGSTNPPRMIELTYTGAGRDRPYAITGKGVTFDSGGLSIKPANSMEWMKSDMAGAAAALAAMRAIGLLKPRINVIAAIPSSENLPSGSSIRPGDVLTHRGGKTSEVLNTDAEGRLILADALAYLSEKNPVAMVDCATLTGAAVVALGDEISAVFGNDPALTRQILAAADEAGEPAWELPLWDNYRRLIDSPIADVKNIGGRGGGAITAALFLRDFVGDTPWVHMDVAGSAFAESSGGDYWPRGGTGTPARTLVRWVLDRAEAGSTKRAARSASGNGSRGKRSTAKRSAAKRSTAKRTAKRSAAASRAKTGARKAGTRR